MVSLCVGGRESDEWEWSDEDKAAEDAQKFLDVSIVCPEGHDCRSAALCPMMTSALHLEAAWL